MPTDRGNLIEAPGWANSRDVVNKPADVSFLIDQIMALEGAERPFEGEIDVEQIGVFGLSLGGATTTLIAFHPEWRDARVAAAISIAGPGDVFGPHLFDHAAVPFLYIAGIADGIVDYEANARPIPDRIHDGGSCRLRTGRTWGSTGWRMVSCGYLATRTRWPVASQALTQRRRWRTPSADCSE